jgi:hypothetical protein
MKLTNVYRVFCPETTQYIISKANGTSFKVDHILSHKASLSKYKKIGPTPYILCDHNTIKLELNNKISNRKYSNNWKLNKLLNDHLVMEEIREEQKVAGI